MAKEKKNIKNNKKKNIEKNDVKKDTKKKNIEKNDIKKVANKKTNRKSYADEKKTNLTPEMKKFIWTCVVVFSVLAIFYLISAFVTGSFKKDDKDAAQVQYNEILAGSSFKMGGTYYVVYYDMSDKENEETNSISTAINSFKTNASGQILYTCDLSNAFNKNYVTTNEPNTNPFGAEDLLINGPTVIKFEDGKVVDYKYTVAEVESYLSSLSTAEK